jgi:hypothetical protein
MNDNKVIKLTNNRKNKQLTKWQKSFILDGEQFTILNYSNYEIMHVDKDYYYQTQQVFNVIGTFISKLISLGVDENKFIWGKGKIADTLIPYQQEYNNCKNQLIEARKRLLYPIMVVEDGSVDVDDLCEEGLAPGKVLVYRQGSSAPNMCETIDTHKIELLSSLCDTVESNLYKIMTDIEDSLVAMKVI